MLVVDCAPLESCEDGVQQVDNELRGGEEEPHQEDEDVCQDLLDVRPLPVRKVFPYDVTGRRSVPDSPVLFREDEEERMLKS